MLRNIATAWLRAHRMKRRRAMVNVYRVFTAESTHVAYADEGDELLLGRYVGESLRGGSRCVVVESVTMSVGEAEALPQDRMIG